LKSYLLSQYGAKKTGNERAANYGGAFIVESGERSYDEIVKNIDRGILFSRFSGGMAAPNGDLSGIAKNSYYIENGEVKYPLSETMIMGNLYDIFKNVKMISKERINSGNAIMPWVLSTGVTISGK